MTVELEKYQIKHLHNNFSFNIFLENHSEAEDTWQAYNPLILHTP